VAALLGAEEYGFATAPLIVSGCVMMRVCHLDTCPVGIATQNPELRKRFTGEPEFVENFFRFLAEEVREILATLGLRSLDEAIGRVDLLDAVPAVEHWKARGLDLSAVLAEPDVPDDAPLHRTTGQDHKLGYALDNAIIAAAEPALRTGTPVRVRFDVDNTDRSVGAMLGGEVTRRYRGAGLPPDTIAVTLRGTAGQSFGAFVPRGVTLRLAGDANDYVGKGLSGGRLVLAPDESAPFVAQDLAGEQSIAGNTVLYGATSGELYARGRVGERFAVRNSGASAVVEGVGDHGCEYMTGGTAVVLGSVGRNFAAGMSGGLAYVLDLAPDRVNREMVDLDPLDAADEADLFTLLANHAETTNSPIAAKLLADWPACVERFTAIVPRDYKAIVKPKPDNADEAPTTGEIPRALSVPGNSGDPQPQGADSAQPPRIPARASLPTSGSSLTAQSGQTGPSEAATGAMVKQSA
jgi:glutamate synthase (NADPH/NADH) large chain